MYLSYLFRVTEKGVESVVFQFHTRKSDQIKQNSVPFVLWPFKTTDFYKHSQKMYICNMISGSLLMSYCVFCLLLFIMLLSSFDR